MRRDSQKELYETFDRFLKQYIIDKNSFLNDEKDILKKESLDEIKSCFVENYNQEKGGFEEKVNSQFTNATSDAKLNFAHAEWLWCFSAGNIKQWRKEDYILRITGIKSEELPNGLFPEPFGNAGQWHTNNKYWEIVFCLTLIEILYLLREENASIDVEELKEATVEFCRYIKNDSELNILQAYQKIIDDRLEGKTFAMSNILLYLAKPEQYERIASNNHKYRIVNSFTALEGEADKEGTIDERIYEIRQKVGELITESQFDFYENSYIKQVWNSSDDEIAFDELEALLFKKAIVFYGPPGTSKTFKAKELAHTFILNQYIKDKSRLKEYLINSKDIVENRIHHLQLHANYTYENFVGGYLLKNGNTELTKGSFIQICEKAKEDLNENSNSDIPHVLILDEMNRVDLSKLFGEVFSALEQRDKEIQVGIEDLKIEIPRNLHIIGTMNEIDFSVEHIDFALRRRFLWFYYGFRPERLMSIIEDKAIEIKSFIIEDNIDRYYRNVGLLNERISNMEDLGEMFQIGHTFFSDIVVIYDQYRKMKGYTKRKKNVLFEGGGPAVILWNISIRPILDAFLGNQEAELKHKYIKELEAIFLNNK